MADTDLQLKIEEYLEEIGTLKEQVEGVRKEEKLKAAKEWGARLKASKEEFERKLKEVVGGGGGGKEVETLKAQMVEWQAATAKQFLSAKNLNEGIKLKLEESEKKGEELRKEGEEKERDIEASMDEIGALKERLEGKEGEVKRLREGGEKEKEANGEMDAILAAVAAVAGVATVAGIVQLQKSISEKDAELKSLSDANRDKNARLEQLTKSLGEKEAELSSLNLSIAASNSSTCEKDALLAQLQKSISDKEAELKSWNDESGEKDALLAQLQRSISEKDAELSSLNQTLAASSLSTGEKDALLAQLQKSIGDKDAELKSYSAQLQSLTSENHTQLQSHQQKIQSLVDENNQAKETALKDCKDMTLRATAAEDQLNKINEAMKVLQEEYTKCKIDLSKLQTSSSTGSDGQHRQLEEAKNMVNLLTSKNGNLEETVKALRSQLEHSREENEAIAERLERERVDSAVKEVKNKRIGVVVKEERLQQGAEPQAQPPSHSSSPSLSDKLNIAHFEGILNKMAEKIDALTVSPPPTPNQPLPPPPYPADDDISNTELLKKITNFLDASFSPTTSTLNTIKTKVEENGGKFDPLAMTLTDVIVKKVDELKQANSSASKEPVTVDMSGFEEKIVERIESLRVNSAGPATSLVKSQSEPIPNDESLKIIQDLKLKLEEKEMQVKGKEEDVVRHTEIMTKELHRFNKALGERDEAICGLKEELSAVKERSGPVDEVALKVVREELAKERAEKKAVRKAAKEMQRRVEALTKELEAIKALQRQHGSGSGGATTVTDGGAGAGSGGEESEESSEKKKEEEKKAKFMEERRQMMERAKEKKRQEKREREMEENGGGGEDDRKPAAVPTTPAVEDSKPKAVEKKSADVESERERERDRSDSRNAATTTWREETDHHPLPPFGLDSPVISHLLTSWTSDIQKVQYLRLYLQCLADYNREVPVTFPKGLTLLGLTEEVKDGFLTLVVPMLQGRSDGVGVKVFSRLGEKGDDDEEEEGGGADDDEENRVVYDLKLRIVRDGGVAPFIPPAAPETPGTCVPIPVLSPRSNFKELL
ncbi:hypothetical protein TrLO_g7855 [Triparma laevis f. longispina]|uniref:Uncharacterized protein n=1 Tax=Triparma laevis f. longispina TaxID=1714387 RepID=A0A9W7A040_9STRA|nr:hypothetical protein TrLO_g7855 [Triparma laevis f. longispina]